MRSPVVHAVGVGQVGEGVSSSWRLEEEEEEDEEEEEEGEMEEMTDKETQRKGIKGMQYIYIYIYSVCIYLFLNMLNTLLMFSR